MTDELTGELMWCKLCDQRRYGRKISAPMTFVDHVMMNAYELECGHRRARSTHTNDDPDKVEIWQ